MTAINGNCVLITGAAAGLGREMAFAFGARGARLALLDRDAAAMEQTGQDLAERGVQVNCYPCDVTDSQALASVAARVQAEDGPVDILVNNAGIVAGKPILEAGMDEMRRVIEVNLLALMHLTKLLLPAMTRRNRGHVVNIASAAGLLAMPRLAPYCASKFAVVGFSDALRQEMKKYGFSGVKVTCVCPSVISTGMFAGFRPPRLNPLLEPASVARRVVRAVAADRTYVKTPFMVHLILLFRMLPAGLVDRIAAMLGTDRAMDGFHGRSPHERPGAGRRSIPSDRR